MHAQLHQQVLLDLGNPWQPCNLDNQSSPVLQ